MKSLLLARQRSVTEVEPQSNFRITQNNPFPDNAKLVITLNKYTNNGDNTELLDTANATLPLAGIAATAQGKAYKFDVGKVDAADGAALALAIAQQR